MPQTERYNRVCDLNTSDGAREFLAAIFIHQLKRHDFTAYIEKHLAGDFACVLSRYLCTAREAASAETTRANLAVDDCNYFEALLERAVDALRHVTECYGLEPETLARIEAIIEDHDQSDGLVNLDHEPTKTFEAATASTHEGMRDRYTFDEDRELALCRLAWDADRSVPFPDYWTGWKAGVSERALASYDELERRLAESNAAHEVAAQNHGALNTEIYALQRRVELLEAIVQQGLHEIGFMSHRSLYRRMQEAMLPVEPATTLYDRRSELGCYFGLGRASWLTLPRVLMEAMPDAWKKGIARLLHEYSETYTNQPDYGTTVRVTVDGKLVPTPDWLINYRHPNHEMINQLRGPKAAAQVDEAEQRKQDDESLQRRHDDERREYFRDDQ